MSNSLTFGVEFEFLIATLDDPSSYSSAPYTTHFPASILGDSYEAIHQQAIDDWDSHNFLQYGLVAEHIANTLRSAGIPAFPWWRSRYRQLGKKLDKFRASDADLAGWEVKIDESVIPSSWILGEVESELWVKENNGGREDSYTYLGMELASPVHTTGFDALGQVDGRVFDDIVRVTEVLKGAYKVTVNSSAGLHVHVGDSHRGFPLSVVRNLMAFLWTFEPGIEKVHPPHRRHERESRYCQPLRSGVRPLFREVVNPDCHRGAHAMEVVYAILSQRTMGVLIDFLTPVAQYQDSDNEIRKSAVNLDNLRKTPEGDEKRTVEFRQFEGTLDGEKAKRWAMFCVMLVRFVQVTDEEILVGVCWQELVEQERGEEYLFMGGVCRMIGFREGCRAWEDVKTGEQPPVAAPTNPKGT